MLLPCLLQSVSPQPPVHTLPSSTEPSGLGPFSPLHVLGAAHQQPPGSLRVDVFQLIENSWMLSEHVIIAGDLSSSANLNANQKDIWLISGEGHTQPQSCYLAQLHPLGRFSGSSFPSEYPQSQGHLFRWSRSPSKQHTYWHKESSDEDDKSAIKLKSRYTNGQTRNSLREHSPAWIYMPPLPAGLSDPWGSGQGIPLQKSAP